MAAGALLGLYAAAVAVTGGFDVRLAGLRLRSHDWVRPLAASGVAIAAAVWLDRRRTIDALASVWRRVDSPAGSRVLTSVAIAWTIAAAASFTTNAVGGADSYGYAGQARLFAEGRLTDAVPLSPAFTWKDAETTLRPLGFTQGRHAGEIAPIYPPGFPLLLAPLAWLGEPFIYLLVPAFGVIMVWGTYRLGARLGDPLAGGSAAVLLALSPTFLFQLFQPMSDVPAAACWLAALLLAFRGTSAAAAGAGLVASIAILIRPNLAPLAAVLCLPMARPRAGAARRLAVFAAAIVPGLLLLGWIQSVRYGSPLASGYGSVRDGFSLANVLPNLARYPSWLTATHTPFVWLWLLAPLWFVPRADIRGRAVTAFAVIVAVWCAYLPYVYFRPDEWFYTRFLLPALPPMLVFSSAVSVWGIRRLPAGSRAAALVILLTGLALYMVASTRRHGAFEMRAQEQKYPRAGAVVRNELPAGAFVIAMQHSGAIRYYAGRPTIRWDLLDASTLDSVVATLRAAGHEPFVVIDVGEDAAFRGKFEAAHQASIRRLTPLAVLGDARVYRIER